MAINGFFLFQYNYFGLTVPLVLIVIYLALFYPQTTFLLVVLLTPLSVNLEEFSDGSLGLFIPTEPILFGLMLLMVYREMLKPSLSMNFWKHPIVLATCFYLIWIFITSITSARPLVSFKFLLMKLWFIIPLLTLGKIVFKSKVNIVKFFWLYVVGIALVVTYTLIRHAGYDFGEKEGHWVMEPFYKDHTIYGAGVAIGFVFVIGLLTYKKHNFQTLLILTLLAIIITIGLYFSYTRGAWLSVVFATGVWFLIKYKIKFKYLVAAGLVIAPIVFLSWHEIQMRLDKIDKEHTTTKFSERIESSANITSDASNLERLNRWSSAWEMFKEKPVFGFGPATYAFEYAPFQDSEDVTIISTNFGDGGNAHSEYLGPLAEMGALGFLSVVAFVIALFYCGITLIIDLKRNYPKEKELYNLILFSILALSTYFFHGLLNNYLDTDKAAVPIYAMAAIIITQQIILNQRKMEEK